MSSAPGAFWRVGVEWDPLDPPPAALYEFKHRFDDPERRARCVYMAQYQATALRERVGDMRLTAAEAAVALRADTARDPGSPAPPTASALRPTIGRGFLETHVLAPISVELDGPLLDVGRVDVRHQLEARHGALLAEHGLKHLDLTDVTSEARAITQAIAGDAYSDGYAGVRFPGHIDGHACYAFFEDRTVRELAAEPISLSPTPEVLRRVASVWDMDLESTAPVFDPPPGLSASPDSSAEDARAIEAARAVRAACFGDVGRSPGATPGAPGSTVGPRPHRSSGLEPPDPGVER